MQLGTRNALAVRLSQREPLHVVRSNGLIIRGPRFSVVCPKIIQHCSVVHAFGEGFLPPFPQQLREGLGGHVDRRLFVKFQSDVQPVHRPCRSHVGHIQSIQDGAVNFGLSFVIHYRVFQVAVPQQRCWQPKPFGVQPNRDLILEPVNFFRMNRCDDHIEIQAFGLVGRHDLNGVLRPTHADATFVPPPVPVG